MAQFEDITAAQAVTTTSPAAGVVQHPWSGDGSAESFKSRVQRSTYFTLMLDGHLAG